MDLPIRRLFVWSDDVKRLQAQRGQTRFVDGVLIRDGYTEPVRVSYRGNRTRHAPKKSYEIRRQSGTLHYNAEYDDPSLVRNALSFWFFNRIGLIAPQTLHCRLYFNDDLLGVYLEIEGVDASFFRRRNLACRSLFYAVNHDADFSLFTGDDTRRLKPSLFDGYERVIGTHANQKRFERFVLELNLRDGEALQHLIARQLDIHQYLQWLAATVCIGHADGLTQNYAVYELSEDGRYRFSPWDCEGTWGRNCYGALCPADTVDPFGENILTAKLMQLPSIRRAYRMRLKRLLNTTFSDATIVPVVREWMHRIGPAVLAEPTRRIHTSQWMSEIDVFRHYVRERRQLLSDALARDEAEDE
ncbi:MAG: CotH kinase family protein [Alicyclobacillus shizuokensis]|nr:CotH kinase family protein [Alicyclobacillus shizuokensis]